MLFELVDENIDTLKYSKHASMMKYFSFDTGIYETLNGYNDKYEYIYPELTFDKKYFC